MLSGLHGPSLSVPLADLLILENSESLEGSGKGPQDKGPSHQGREQMWEGQGRGYALRKSVFHQSLPALSL